MFGNTDILYTCSTTCSGSLARKTCLFIVQKLKGVDTLGKIQGSIFCELFLRIVSGGPMAHVRLAPHLSRMCRQFLHFFLSFYDASIVLLRNLGTTKMDPQNKCFFHANFYSKSGFWPTSLQRKIMKFAQFFFSNLPKKGRV